VVQFCFNWDHLSVIAGMHWSGVCFRLYEGAVKKEQVVEFLKALRTQFRQRLLIVWDGATPHRSRVVREYVASTQGQIEIQRLPPYCPELNPVEYLWAWLKRHALANYCPDTLAELKHMARSKLKSGQRRCTIIASCWTQAKLL
jgi:transposase